MVRFLVVGILLLCSSIQDVKTRKLSNRGLIVGGIAVVILLLTEWLCSGWIAGVSAAIRSVPWERLMGALPGLGLLVLSYGMRGQIGRGDAYLMCISGAALGVKQGMALLFYALLLAGSISLVLLVLRKVKKDTKIPFVPFLLGGYLLSLIQQFA